MRLWVFILFARLWCVPGRNRPHRVLRSHLRLSPSRPPLPSGKSLNPLPRLTLRICPMMRFCHAPGVNLDDRLRDVPGFSLFRRSSSLASHPTTQGISLRGIGSSAASRTLVLFDGLPANDPFGGWVYWSRLQSGQHRGGRDFARGFDERLWRPGDGRSGFAAHVDTRGPPFSQGLSKQAMRGLQTRAEATRTCGDQWVFPALVPWLEISDGFFMVPEGLRGSIDRKADVDFITGDARLDFFRDQDQLTVRSNIVAEQRINGTSLRNNSSSLGTVGAHYQREGLSITGYHLRGTLRSTFSRVNAARDEEALTLLQRVTSEDSGGSVVWSRSQNTWNLILGADTHRASGMSRDTVVLQRLSAQAGREALATGSLCAG